MEQSSEFQFSESGQSEDIHDYEDTGNEEFTDDNNMESNLRRRKGKIMSCAKETIENGTKAFYYFYLFNFKSFKL